MQDLLDPKSDQAKSTALSADAARPICVPEQTRPDEQGLPQIDVCEAGEAS